MAVILLPPRSGRGGLRETAWSPRHPVGVRSFRLRHVWRTARPTDSRSDG